MSKAEIRSVDSRAQKLPLNNSDAIFPATISKKQHHLYRCSMTLHEKIDPVALQQAFEKTAPRFPFIAARLTQGLCWYALSPAKVLSASKENGQLMRHMTHKEMRGCCLRVLYTEYEIIAEFLHALCDGCAAMIFLRTLTAQYLYLKSGARIPCEKGVLDCEEAPKPVEWEDSYKANAGDRAQKRDGQRAFIIKGEPNEGGALRKSVLTIGVDHALKRAKEYGVTLNEYLVSAMLKALLTISEKAGCTSPMIVTVPVNLRKLFKSETLRNFSLFAKASVSHRSEEWPLRELCRRVHGQLESAITVDEMRAGITTNVRLTQNPLVRYLPLFIKNPIMQIAYAVFGTKASSLSLSNMGRFELPDEMKPYVRDVYCFMDSNPRTTNSCAAITYDGLLKLCFCRSIRETALENAFERALAGDGLAARWQDEAIAP